jgi:hypothetical protein
VAIGDSAGSTNQQQYAIAIGPSAGSTNQQYSAVAIGPSAGSNGQQGSAVAIGVNSGSKGQQGSAVAIGASAGFTGQGANAIAIGTFAGYTGQFGGSIILNASGQILNTAGNTGLYVNPVRLQNGGLSGFTGAVQYNPTTYELVCNETKTFVIDHPVDAKNKYLVHACLEGPESGVYYRGKSEIVNGSSVEVQLPSYVGTLCTDLTVQITHIYDGAVKAFSASEVDSVSNSFTVYGENGRFNWLVHGKRADIVVEPSKADVSVRGDGPYKYIL